MREDCEVTPCSSILCKASVAASSLTPVGYCTLFQWIKWWLLHIWRVPYPSEGLGFYKMASVPCNDTGYSVMILGTAWVLEPVGRSWGPRSFDSSWQASLVRGMIKYYLRWRSFARVRFSCIVISDWSSTRIFQFPGTVTFLMFSTV